jgi:hypothetical protein
LIIYKNHHQHPINGGTFGLKNKVIVLVNQCNRFEDVSRVCIFICKSSPYHFCSSNFHIPNGIAVDEGLNLDPSDERQDLSQCIASEKTMKRITAVARGRVQG